MYLHVSDPAHKKNSENSETKSSGGDSFKSVLFKVVVNEANGLIWTSLEIISVLLLIALWLASAWPSVTAQEPERGLRG